MRVGFLFERVQGRKSVHPTTEYLITAKKSMSFVLPLRSCSSVFVAPLCFYCLKDKKIQWLGLLHKKKGDEIFPCPLTVNHLFDWDGIQSRIRHNVRDNIIDFHSPPHLDHPNWQSKTPKSGNNAGHFPFLLYIHKTWFLAKISGINKSYFLSFIFSLAYHARPPSERLGIRQL